VEETHNTHKILVGSVERKEIAGEGRRNW